MLYLSTLPSQLQSTVPAWRWPAIAFFTYSSFSLAMKTLTATGFWVAKAS
ncbi:MAG: hypothetical protein AAGB13_16930 [Cyanobacteria bacterium P01_F01_bin.33]